jgi:putative transposase
VFWFIAAEKTNYPVAVMCRVFGVSRTGFHNWERRAPSDRALQDAWLTERIKQIHDASRGVYGAPRIHAELRLEHGIRVGRKRVARLMKAAAISGVRPRKRWRTTIRIRGITPATDVVERRFRPTSTNVLWVADITYLRTGRVGCTSPRCRTPTRARSSAGRWPPTCARAWSSTRSRWRSPAGVPAPG